MSATQQSMTVEDARNFEHFSVHNAVQAEMACTEQTCRAYIDIFTFRRWRAQGLVVRKGEKGTTITTWIADARAKANADDTQASRQRPKRAVLFCRHQVEAIAGR